MGQDDGPVQEAVGPSSCRRFSSGDAMVAIVAVALSLTVARVLLPFFQRGLSGVPFKKLSSLSDWREYLATRPEVAGAIVVFTSLGLIVLLVVGSLAFVLMRLRRPRPPLGRVLLQPGMVAAEAALAGVVVGLGLAVSDIAAIYGMLALSSAVPLAWAALALAGWWRPEPGWIDRLGRAVGIGWCLLVPVYLALIVVFVWPRLW
jgi:hypothetical protein